MVSHKGAIVLERYFNGARAAQPANIKSASKSVISALVGIAVSRGLIKSVDQKIGDYFPELASDPEPKKREITHRRSADDAVGARVDERPQLRRVGAESELGALRAAAAADRRAGHARRIQHRQLASAVGHPDQGHEGEHVAVRAGSAGEAARILAREMAARIRKASTSAATKC